MLQSSITSREAAGISFILLDALSLAAIYIFMKCLSTNMDSNAVVFLYKLGCLIIILPWVLKGGFSALKTTNLKLHMVRGLFSAAGSLFFMYSLRYVNVVDAVALGFLEQIFWVIASVLLFKEKLDIYKIIAIIVGFIGALLVIYPGFIRYNYPFIDIRNIFINYNIYYTYTILAAVCWTCNCICIKVLGGVVSNKTQSFYGLLFSSIVAFISTFINRECYSGECLYHLSIKLPEFQAIDSIYFFGIVVCYIAHTGAIFKAMQNTDMSILAPYYYFKLVFAAIIGYVVLGESPNSFSYYGYVLIILSGIILIKRKYERVK
jgi:drug/metabolite transporter (DMT)-like permease